MGLTSTPFLSYHDIQTGGIDLYEDAFGLYQEFSDVIGYIKQVKPAPGRQMECRLIMTIRKLY